MALLPASTGTLTLTNVRISSSLCERLFREPRSDRRERGMIPQPCSGGVQPKALPPFQNLAKEGCCAVQKLLRSHLKRRRRGGREWTDHPAAPFKGCLRRFFLTARPPLLRKGNNILGSR